MGYISGKKSFLLRQLASIETRIEKYESALADMSETGAEQYKFSSGEGDQSTKRRSISEIQDVLERLYAQWNSVYNRLYCAGLVSVNLRRKKPNALF